MYIIVFIFFHVLHSTLYLLFSENELNIDGKKQKLKKEESNNIVVTNARKERREMVL